MFNFLEKAKGVLGINARNLHYVSRYNTPAAKKFADDKLYTKQFLQSRHMGVAKLYQIIKNYQELQNLNLLTLPQSFVVKPNRGYGGEGIMVIAGRKGNKFLAVNGNEMTVEDLFYHCIDILDGKYAISGTHDQVIIEEFLESHEVFDSIVPEGLPDIRVIVFNFVPLIAMLRIPTIESQGKANLHLGAIGVGIDIGTGKTTFGIRHNRYIRKFPNGELVSGLVLPYWDEILMTASKIQQVSKIGYLAVDLALAKTGIKILEVNARAGLSVQIANRAFLKTRLEQIRDLKVINPKQGVEVAKTLFAKQIQLKQEIEMKPVIGLYEPVTLLKGSNPELIAKINPYGMHNLIDRSLLVEKSNWLDLLIQNKRNKLTFRKVDLSKKKYRLVLAGKYLGDYLIDCKKPFPLLKDKISQQNIKRLENIDKKITEIDSKIHLLSALKPQNLREEKEAFFNNTTFSPQFIYKSPKADLDFLLKELEKLPQIEGHPLSSLYQQKTQEIQRKIQLIKNINNPNFTRYSELLYGNVNLQLYRQASHFIKKTRCREDKSPFLKFKEIVETLEQFLKQNNLDHWKITVMENATTDMQVNKEGTIFIRKGVKFSANRLQALIAHEIETHVYRLENAKKQSFGLLTRGTANYLTTEEGLAIYNQNKLDLALGDKVLWPAFNVVAVYLSNRMSFVDLFHFLKEKYKIEDELAWKLCVKVKRGICDTAQKLTFTKDIVYFKGEQLVQDFLKNPKNKLEDLYIGKIGVEDVGVLKNFKEFKVKYLPQ